MGVLRAEHYTTFEKNYKIHTFDLLEYQSFIIVFEIVEKKIRHFIEGRIFSNQS